MGIYVLVCHPSFLPSFFLPLIWRSMGTKDLAATYATAKGDLVEWIYLVTPSEKVGVDTMVLVHRFLSYCNRSLILEHNTDQIVAKMVQEAKMMAKYCTPIFFIDSARPYPPKEKEVAGSCVHKCFVYVEPAVGQGAVYRSCAGPQNSFDRPLFYESQGHGKQ